MNVNASPWYPPPLTITPPLVSPSTTGTSPYAHKELNWSSSPPATGCESWPCSWWSAAGYEGSQRYGEEDGYAGVYGGEAACESAGYPSVYDTQLQAVTSSCEPQEVSYSVAATNPSSSCLKEEEEETSGERDASDAQGSSNHNNHISTASTRTATTATNHTNTTTKSSKGTRREDADATIEQSSHAEPRAEGDVHAQGSCNHESAEHVPQWCATAPLPIDTEASPPTSPQRGGAPGSHYTHSASWMPGMCRSHAVTSSVSACAGGSFAADAVPDAYMHHPHNYMHSNKGYHGGNSLPQQDALAPHGHCMASPQSSFCYYNGMYYPYGSPAWQSGSASLEFNESVGRTGYMDAAAEYTGWTTCYTERTTQDEGAVESHMEVQQQQQQQQTELHDATKDVHPCDTAAADEHKDDNKNNTTAVHNETNGATNEKDTHFTMYATDAPDSSHAHTPDSCDGATSSSMEDQRHQHDRNDAAAQQSNESDKESSTRHAAQLHPAHTIHAAAADELAVSPHDDNTKPRTESGHDMSPRFTTGTCGEVRDDAPQPPHSVEDNLLLSPRATGPTKPHRTTPAPPSLGSTWAAPSLSPSYASPARAKAASTSTTTTTRRRESDTCVPSKNITPTSASLTTAAAICGDASLPQRSSHSPSNGNSSPRCPTPPRRFHRYNPYSFDSVLVYCEAMPSCMTRKDARTHDATSAAPSASAVLAQGAHSNTTASIRAGVNAPSRSTAGATVQTRSADVEGQTGGTARNPPTRDHAVAHTAECGARENAPLQPSHAHTASTVVSSQAKAACHDEETEGVTDARARVVQTGGSSSSSSISNRNNISNNNTGHYRIALWTTQWALATARDVRARRAAMRAVAGGLRDGPERPDNYPVDDAVTNAATKTATATTVSPAVMGKEEMLSISTDSLSRVRDNTADTNDTTKMSSCRTLPQPPPPPPQQQQQQHHSVTTSVSSARLPVTAALVSAMPRPLLPSPRPLRSALPSALSRPPPPPPTLPTPPLWSHVGQHNNTPSPSASFASSSYTNAAASSASASASAAVAVAAAANTAHVSSSLVPNAAKTVAPTWTGTSVMHTVYNTSANSANTATMNRVRRMTPPMSITPTSSPTLMQPPRLAARTIPAPTPTALSPTSASAGSMIPLPRSRQRQPPCEQCGEQEGADAAAAAASLTPTTPSCVTAEDGKRKQAAAASPVSVGSKERNETVDYAKDDTSRIDQAPPQQHESQNQQRQKHSHAENEQQHQQKQTALSVEHEVSESVGPVRREGHHGGVITYAEAVARLVANTTSPPSPHAIAVASSPRASIRRVTAASPASSSSSSSAMSSATASLAGMSKRSTLSNAALASSSSSSSLSLSVSSSSSLCVTGGHHASSHTASKLTRAERKQMHTPSSAVCDDNEDRCKNANRVHTNSHINDPNQHPHQTSKDKSNDGAHACAMNGSSKINNQRRTTENNDNQNTSSSESISACVIKTTPSAPLVMSTHESVSATHADTSSTAKAPTTSSLPCSCSSSITAAAAEHAEGSDARTECNGEANTPPTPPPHSHRDDDCEMSLEKDESNTCASLSLCAHAAHEENTHLVTPGDAENKEEAKAEVVQATQQSPADDSSAHTTCLGREPCAAQTALCVQDDAHASDATACTSAEAVTVTRDSRPDEMNDGSTCCPTTSEQTTTTRIWMRRDNSAVLSCDGAFLPQTDEAEQRDDIAERQPRRMDGVTAEETIVSHVTKETTTAEATAAEEEATITLAAVVKSAVSVSECGSSFPGAAHTTADVSTCAHTDMEDAHTRSTDARDDCVLNKRDGGDDGAATTRSAPDAHHHEIRDAPLAPAPANRSEASVTRIRATCLREQEEAALSSAAQAAQQSTTESTTTKPSTTATAKQAVNNTNDHTPNSPTTDAPHMVSANTRQTGRRARRLARRTTLGGELADSPAAAVCVSASTSSLSTRCPDASSVAAATRTSSVSASVPAAAAAAATSSPSSSSSSVLVGATYAHMAATEHKVDDLLGLANEAGHLSSSRLPIPSAHVLSSLGTRAANSNTSNTASLEESHGSTATLTLMGIPLQRYRSVNDLLARETDELRFESGESAMPLPTTTRGAREEGSCAADSHSGAAAAAAAAGANSLSVATAKSTVHACATASSSAAARGAHTHVHPPYANANIAHASRRSSPTLQQRNVVQLLRRALSLEDNPNAKMLLLQRALGQLSDSLTAQCPALVCAVLLEASHSFTDMERTLQFCYQALVVAEKYALRVFMMLAHLALPRTLARIVDITNAQDHLIQAARLALGGEGGVGGATETTPTPSRPGHTAANHGRRTSQQQQQHVVDSTPMINSIGSYNNSCNSLTQYPYPLPAVREDAALGWIALQLGVTLELAGNFAASVQWYRVAEALAQVTHQPRLRCDALLSQAIACYAVGEMEAAGRARACATAMLYRFPRPWRQHPLQSLVQIKLQLGDMTGALTLHQEELALARSQGDVSTIARCMGSIALVQKHLGRYEEACHMYLQELATCEVADARQATESYIAAASCCLLAGHCGRALEYGTRAVRQAELSKDYCTLTKALAEMADVELARGSLTVARGNVSDAIVAMSRVEEAERRQYLVKATLCELEWRCCHSVIRIVLAARPRRRCSDTNCIAGTHGSSRCEPNESLSEEGCESNKMKAVAHHPVHTHTYTRARHADTDKDAASTTTTSERAEGCKTAREMYTNHHPENAHCDAETMTQGLLLEAVVAADVCAIPNTANIRALLRRRWRSYHHDTQAAPSCDGKEAPHSQPTRTTLSSSSSSSLSSSYSSSSSSSSSSSVVAVDAATGTVTNDVSAAHSRGAHTEGGCEREKPAVWRPCVRSPAESAFFVHDMVNTDTLMALLKEPFMRHRRIVCYSLPWLELSSCVAFVISLQRRGGAARDRAAQAACVSADSPLDIRAPAHAEACVDDHNNNDDARLHIEHVPLQLSRAVMTLLVNPNALNTIFDEPMRSIDAASRRLYPDTPLWPQHYSKAVFDFEAECAAAQAAASTTLSRSNTDAASAASTNAASTFVVSSDAACAHADVRTEAAGASAEESAHHENESTAHRLAHDPLFCLQMLYDTFMRPLEYALEEPHTDEPLASSVSAAPSTKSRGLIFVADGIFSRLPFAAMHNGHTYVATRYSTTSCSSLALLLSLHAAQRQRRTRALEASMNTTTTPLDAETAARGCCEGRVMRVRVSETAVRQTTGHDSRSSSAPRWNVPSLMDALCAAAEQEEHAGLRMPVVQSTVIDTETCVPETNGTAAVLNEMTYEAEPSRTSSSEGTTTTTTATINTTAEATGAVRALLTQLYARQRDRVVSNRLYQAVHAPLSSMNVASRPQCAVLELLLPVVPEIREDFCGYFCHSSSDAVVAHARDIAMTWNLTPYDLVCCSCGVYGSFAIHETGIPVYRALSYAGATRLLLPTGSRAPAHTRVGVAAVRAAARGECVADAMRQEQCRAIAAGAPLAEWAAYTLCGLP